MKYKVVSMNYEVVRINVTNYTKPHKLYKP